MQPRQTDEIQPVDRCDAARVRRISAPIEHRCIEPAEIRRKADAPHNRRNAARRQIERGAFFSRPPHRLIGPACERVDTVLLDEAVDACVDAVIGVVIAAQLGVRLQALPRDDEGPLAHAFEALCKTDKPSALYCNPTLQNPSTLTLSQQRREALADVALRYSIPVIEDDACAMLPHSAPAALASFAPELTYYVTGLSKSLGAGLRVAHLHAPTARQTQRLDGTANDMLNAIRNESRARQAIAARMLEAWPYEADPDGFHLWLPVPVESGWSASELALQLRNQGIAAVAGAAFSTDGNPPNAMRMCLGGSKTRDECEEALRIVGETLDHPHHLHSPVM
jgi:DNA-binding transcriptional MocR family regulator